MTTECYSSPPDLPMPMPECRDRTEQNNARCSFMDTESPPDDYLDDDNTLSDISQITNNNTLMLPLVDSIKGTRNTPFYKIFPGRKTVVLNCTVGAVKGLKPLVGLAEEVEKAWKKLMARFGIKERREQLITRTVSSDHLNKENGDDFLPPQSRYRRGSDVGSTLNKFKQLEQQNRAESKDDVFSADWVPPTFDKDAADYGRPKPGSLTEKRGIAAGNHVGKEIVQLCEVITENGFEGANGMYVITFGHLFNVYNYISDKVVGMLIRARRHKLLDFDGEMLYQKQDDHKIITLLKPFDEVREMYNQSDDPARVLKKLW